MKYFICSIVFGLAVAAHGKCLSVSEEAVSLCRAQVACGNGKASTTIGVALGGFGSGFGGHNYAMDNYNKCVDRDLDAQKTNAALAAQLRSLDSERASEGNGGFNQCTDSCYRQFGSQTHEVDSCYDLCKQKYSHQQ